MLWHAGLPREEREAQRHAAAGGGCHVQVGGQIFNWQPTGIPCIFYYIDEDPAPSKEKIFVTF